MVKQITQEWRLFANSSILSRCSSVILLLWAIHSGATPQEGVIRVDGVYFNNAYQYSVVVPKGVRAYRTKAPAPDHGVVIYLDDKRRSLISVDASYNTLGFRSGREATEDDLRSEACGSPTLKNAALGVLPASDGETHCTAKDGNVTIRRVVKAVSDSPGAVGVIYQVELRTSPFRYAGDRELFSRIVQSFQLGTARR